MPNETITGKIYPVWNATKTERRFPQTVIEAVLGLPTYLQDQFSALADIYMPIEGITESKTGQEFVYRKSPATIKAKSLTLDRIYGKTLAWNQLIQYGDSVSISNGWSVSNGTLSGNVFTATAPNGYIATPSYACTTHKLFLAAVIKTDAEANKVHCYTGNSGAAPEAGNVSSSGIQVVKQIGTSWASSSGTGSGYIIDYRTSGWTPITIYSVCVIDLTLMFGAGNEPSTVEEFEALFPLSYYPYNPGTLISNDASALETTGFNQWDEEWDRGIYVYEGTDGTMYRNNSYFCSKNKIRVIPGQSYYAKTPAQLEFAEYDANGNFIRIAPYRAQDSIITISNDAYYINFNVTTGGAITTYNHDICINLSDPAKNGTYEPYRKTTLQLGLNNFKVKDGNGNITTITGGLKSDRSGKYDEIVGNKVIQRAARRAYQSGDENDQTVVTDGTYTDYGLATPIEYELVEPLVYSMAAGTTEARVSPNTDGLSAPFCCDMTYDANANNDSANAQYAATAGRLYNTHKLWGRDFDGSNDVSGALSGVTTIEASGNITTVAQLISTVATGTAPLSVASTTEVANLHSYTATKLHTQRTLWGQSFDGSGNVTGDMSSVGNIAFSASGKNIASLLYFDTTNSRVGVGVSSPAYKLDISGTLNASGATTLGSTLGVTGNTTLDGTVRIGGSSGATLSWVSANSGLSIDKGFYSTSYITAGTSNASSDIRLKDNVTSISYDKALRILSALKGKEWDWNDKKAFLKGTHGTGLIAQEVRDIMPWAVLDLNGELSLNYNSLWGIAIPVMQALYERILNLESKLNA